MGTGILTIDFDAIVRNWRSLAALSQAETGAVVKANGYGLGAPAVARRLAREGVRTFYVAVAEEGAILRSALGPGPEIFVFSGHMHGDTDAIRDHRLSPMLNSIDQMLRHFESLPNHPFAVQLDTGMNRLGLEPAEWAAIKDMVLPQGPRMIASHLACADEPDHIMNAEQLRVFRSMTDGVDVPRSLSATGGILLGPDYHFDHCRPGIGLYGGKPHHDAVPVVTLDLPVIQCRDLEEGETVGYGNAWTAKRRSRIATVSTGYADGLIRAMGANGYLHADNVPIRIAGRVSMDLVTADVTDLGTDPDSLQVLGQYQSIDTVAQFAGTIGYEILTSLGARYRRQVLE